MEWYVENEYGRPVKISDLKEWSGLLNVPRQVAYNYWFGLRISTVFLAVDHNFGDGDPILYETMTFGWTEDGYWNTFCERYHTREEAKAGHRRILHVVMAWPVIYLWWWLRTQVSRFNT